MVLVHFGDPAVTGVCLRALAPQAADALVVVSNNGSEDDARRLEQALRDAFGQCARLAPGQPAPDGARALLVHNGANRGFAAGCNAGLRPALADPDVTHAWLLNNDTRPEPGALAALMAEAAARPGAVLGATVVRADAPERLQLAGGVRYNPALSTIAPAHAGAALADVPTLPEPRLDYVYGASMCVPASLLREAGLLDEGYFLFYEELDFCRRAVALGAELGWCRGCVVVHEESAAVGRPDAADAADGARLARAAYHEARSTLRFTRRHHPWLLPPVLAARCVAKPLALLLRGRPGLIRPALRGALDGLLGRPAPPAS